MSSAPKGERRPADDYPTEPKLADFLTKLTLKNHLQTADPQILEPSAGSGNFVKALRRFAPVESEITAIDPDSDFVPGGQYRSTLEGWYDSREEYDLIIGNPPYSLALPHIEMCLDMLAPGGCLAFLLRMSFFESRARYPFWKKHPCSHIYTLSERPSFVWSWKCVTLPGCGYRWTTLPGEDQDKCPNCGFMYLTCTRTDSAAYGWFVWTNDEGFKPTQLEVVSWKGEDLLD